jgi:hypothetical protein
MVAVLWLCGFEPFHLLGIASCLCWVTGIPCWHLLAIACLCATPQFEEGHDWSIGVASDSPQGKDVRRITGTLIAAPLSVLRGEPHTVSSMLEGVFLSVLSIACEGKITGYDLMTDKIKKWEYTRAGALQRLELPEEDETVDHLKPLVHSLHDLFYPMPVDGSKTRGYCQTVTVKHLRSGADCMRCHSAKRLGRPMVIWIV